ncbi:hypothetical protein FDP41_007727 [Naegleria fowleri]|uniref:Uncharacterized protein n=1 Tax=Naegleria fowleri TaxID=5763 RepID=A0A6A5CA01_NAEFO|nr:uncharacterized protein FDP41_007727 [Naegleria fowleri]KAF0983812.1 hypothetical protein FDP41_007727 [Naegleria fowleri]CAG4717511.1 unnamed protein product [Naegleria fowleri]
MPTNTLKHYLELLLLQQKSQFNSTQGSIPASSTHFQHDDKEIDQAAAMVGSIIHKHQQRRHLSSSFFENNNAKNDPSTNQNEKRTVIKEGNVVQCSMNGNMSCDGISPPSSSPCMGVVANDARHYPANVNNQTSSFPFLSNPQNAQITQQKTSLMRYYLKEWMSKEEEQNSLVVASSSDHATTTILVSELCLDIHQLWKFYMPI